MRAGKNFSNFYLFIAFFNSETSYNIKITNEQKEMHVYRSFQNVCKSFQPAAARRFDHCSTHNYNGSFSLREVARGRANEWKQNRVGWGRTALKWSSIIMFQIHSLLIIQIYIQFLYRRIIAQSFYRFKLLNQFPIKRSHNRAIRDVSYRICTLPSL